MNSSIDEAIIADYEDEELHKLLQTLGKLDIGDNVARSLRKKVRSAINTNEHAGQVAIGGHEKTAQNAIKATSNFLEAFINELEALKGKKISEEVANRLIESAEKLRGAKDVYGLNFLPHVYNEESMEFMTALYQRTMEKVSSSREIVGDIENLGYDVRVKWVDNDLTIQVVHHSVTAVIIAGISIASGAFSAYQTYSEIKQVERQRGVDIPLADEVALSAADGAIAGALTWTGLTGIQAFTNMYALYGLQGALGLIGMQQVAQQLVLSRIYEFKANGAATLAERGGLVPNACNWIQEKVHEITHPNQPPTADFTYSPSFPAVLEKIQFVDRSWDPDGRSCRGSGHLEMGPLRRCRTQRTHIGVSGITQ